MSAKPQRSNLPNSLREAAVFEIRQQASHYAQKRHVGAGVVDGFDAVGVGKRAEDGRSYAADSEGKPEEESRNHTELGREEFLSVEQDGREGRREHEAGAETEHRREGERNVRELHRERRGAED